MLSPEWLPKNSLSRFGAGVEFTCPTHGGDCRVQVWFANPCDGGKPLPPLSGKLYRTNRMCGWSRLTVVGEIDMGPHGIFTIKAGQARLVIH